MTKGHYHNDFYLFFCRFRLSLLIPLLILLLHEYYKKTLLLILILYQDNLLELGFTQFNELLYSDLKLNLVFTLPFSILVWVRHLHWKLSPSLFDFEQKWTLKAIKKWILIYYCALFISFSFCSCLVNYLARISSSEIIYFFPTINSIVVFFLLLKVVTMGLCFTLFKQL
jgi:Sec-independent protein secretion pathway component TatC